MKQMFQFLLMIVLTFFIFLSTVLFLIRREENIIPSFNKEIFEREIEESWTRYKHPEKEERNQRTLR
jgi:hypothetical protein